MINYLNTSSADFAESLKALRTPPTANAVIRRRVAGILRKIHRHGDAAVLALTAQFDGWQPPTTAALAVSPVTLKAAANTIDATLKADLQTAANRIHTYHQRQAPQGWTFTDETGNTMGEIVHPVRRAVVYAPGGKAAYPSSVLMGVIPAKVAGVEEIIVVTPAPDGKVSPVTLAAAYLAGAHRVFMLGGAQAVGAFAYGTETLPQADVIVGPGNAYVAEAKRQVFGMVGVDSIAGPSEVLIISDGTPPADWVAADMLAQAEHDEDAQSITISPDVEHLQAIRQAIEKQLATATRGEIIRPALKNRGALIAAQNLDECIRIADSIAAEHLQVMTQDATAVAARIKNAGGVFVGHHSCVPLGDFAAGPSHVLPTNGTARFASPLSVSNFVKRSGYLHASEVGAGVLAATTERLAKAEGLYAHADSAKRRNSAN